MYKESMRQTWVEIDLSALDHNIKAIKEAIGKNLFHDDVVRELGRYLNYDKAHNEYLNIEIGRAHV